VSERTEWIHTPEGEWHRVELALTAGDWHSGQSSPLYALASSGSVVAGLAAEAGRCVDLAEAEGDWEAAGALRAIVALAELEEGQ
jgi:hypothetical protein